MPRRDAQARKGKDRPLALFDFLMLYLSLTALALVFIALLMGTVFMANALV
jgi:hypothetical protein